MRKGFTVIEVLVVVAIVGILSSVVLSGMSKGGQSQSPSVSDAVVPTGYVNDTARVLGDTSALEAQLKAFKDSGKGEIAVLTVPTTNGMDIEEYGIEVADKWKVGNAGKDDGVIFIVATQDRRMRIEVGHGAEAWITDAQAGRILSDVVTPKFKAGDWKGGVQGGVGAIISAYGN